MGINNPGGHVWKVNLTDQQKINSLVRKEWAKNWKLQYELLETLDEQNHFLKERLRDTEKANGDISNEEFKLAYQDFLIKKLNYAKKQLANASTAKGQEPREPIQEKEPNKNEAVKKINWQGTQTQLVFLWEKLFEMGMLNPMDESQKWILLVESFVVKGKHLNPGNLKKAAQNLLNHNKRGLPKNGEKFEVLLKEIKSLGD